MSKLEDHQQKALAFLDKHGPLASFNITEQGRKDFDELVELGLAVTLTAERYGLLPDGSYGKRMDYTNYHVTEEGKAALHPEPPKNRDLRYASTILDGLRFDSFDQNPKGIRDILFSAAEKERRMTEALLLAEEALATGYEPKRREALAKARAVFAEFGIESGGAA